MAEDNTVDHNVVEFTTKDGTKVVLNLYYRTVTVEGIVYDVSKILELVTIIEDNISTEIIG